MEEEKKIQKDYQFLVAIKGKNTDFEVPINSLEDLGRVYEILDILKKKMR